MARARPTRLQGAAIAGGGFKCDGIGPHWQIQPHFGIFHIGKIQQRPASHGAKPKYLPKTLQIQPAMAKKRAIPFALAMFDCSADQLKGQPTIAIFGPDCQPLNFYEISKKPCSDTPCWIAIYFAQPMR